jgi:hypothetical protein
MSPFFIYDKRKKYPSNTNTKLTHSSKRGRRKMSQEVTAAFTENFPGVLQPTQQAIHKPNARYEESGSGADLPGHNVILLHPVALCNLL